MPANAKAEAYALRDSIDALSDENAEENLNSAYDHVADYLKKNPDQSLDMQTVRDMFGEYGPIALAALQDEDGNVNKALENGNAADHYKNSVLDVAQREVDSFSDKYKEINGTAYGRNALGSADNLVADAEGWQGLLDIEKGNSIQKPDVSLEARMLGATMSEAAIAAASTRTLEQCMSGSTEFGLQLAEKSMQYALNNNTTGWCYRGVINALSQMGVDINGPSAFCAVDELDSKYSDMFTKFTYNDISKDQLYDLPVGTIVVYGQGSGANGGYHGHIYVAQSDGRETSDHLQNIYPYSFGDEYYVYFPK